MFAKIFATIFDSSIADDPDLRHFFMDMLILSDEEGIVDMTPRAIAARTRLPVEVVERRLKDLELPDDASRTPDMEGRRIVRLDEGRQWGWRIVNYLKYRQSATKAMLRMAEAERKREWRRRKGFPVPLPKQERDTEAEGEGEGEADKSRTCPGQGSGGRVAGATPASKRLPDSQWLSELKADPAYEGIDIDREHAKASRWCKEKRKQLSRSRFINWLNRADGALTGAQPKKANANGTF